MNHKMTTFQILEGYFLKGSNVILGQVQLHQNTYDFFFCMANFSLFILLQINPFLAQVIFDPKTFAHKTFTWNKI